jgi:hypothetical protein
MAASATVAPKTETTPNIGKITQVIGSTFDAQFAEHQLPAIYNAVKIVSDRKGVKLNLTGEVQQHLGGGGFAASPWEAPTAWSAARIASTPARR